MKKADNNIAKSIFDIILNLPATWNIEEAQSTISSMLNKLSEDNKEAVLDSRMSDNLINYPEIVENLAIPGSVTAYEVLVEYLLHEASPEKIPGIESLGDLIMSKGIENRLAKHLTRQIGTPAQNNEPKKAVSQMGPKRGPEDFPRFTWADYTRFNRGDDTPRKGLPFRNKRLLLEQFENGEVGEEAPVEKEGSNFIKRSSDSNTDWFMGIDEKKYKKLNKRNNGTGK